MSYYTFKEGDKVRAMRECSGSFMGKIYTLERRTDELLYLGSTDCNCQKGWELVSTINEKGVNMLQALESLSNLAQRTFNEKTKKFYRVGWLNKELEITEEFKKVAAEILMEFVMGEKTFTVDDYVKAIEARADEIIAKAEQAEKK